MPVWPRPEVRIRAACARASVSFPACTVVRSDRNNRSSSKASNGSAVVAVGVVGIGRGATVAAAANARIAPMRIAIPQTAKPCMPSRNSISWDCALRQDGRRRPAKYPPSPKLASEVSNNQTPPNRAKVQEVSRQLEDGEATAKPMDEPKDNRTNDSAAAVIAPVMTGVQYK